ncbi:MAG TPA: hypothetical protein VG796_04705 [Verrucomicrobiales bacterium]|nr:hypothetical protein [Verrucomicrobiales bacterium]
MSEKSVPESSLAKKPRRGWWRRVGWKMAVLLVLLAAGFYYEEKVRGRRALERAEAAYEAEGESLRAEDYLTKAPPVEENFGATPLLAGMMTGENPEDSRQGAVRRRFFALSPPHPDPARDPWELSRTAERKAEEKATKSASRKSIRRDDNEGLTINWRSVREDMSRYGSREPPEEESSDVRAVDAALESERPLFDELAAAASRPYAVLTPAPAERADPLGSGGLLYFWRDWSRLIGTVRLRVLAAITLGRLQEAAGLAKVLWRLRDAGVAEGGLFAYWQAGAAGIAWNACVCDIMRSSGSDDNILRTLQNHVPNDWSPERELLQAARGGAAFAYADWRKVIAAAENSFTGDLYGFFKFRYIDQTKGALYSPSGWLSLSAARDIDAGRVYQIKPLRRLDFAVLPPVQSEKWEDNPSFWEAPWYLHAGRDSTLEHSVSFPLKTRLMLLVLGMERYRLRHGRYPARAAALVPEFLKAMPKDMDSRPLRVATSEDGARSVVYSIGWNMVDDWHGDVPEKFAGGVERDADLTVSLPFPALPRP